MLKMPITIQFIRATITISIPCQSTYDQIISIRYASLEFVILSKIVFSLKFKRVELNDLFWSTPYM